jgi:cysteine desulfuration protein SufE
MRTDDLPPRLAAIVEEFQELERPQRLELLLEFSQGLPPLPARFEEHPELLEAVPECQSPIFVATEIAPRAEVTDPDADPDAADPEVRVFFRAPREAPTTRGFAGILAEGVDGLGAAQVLALPDDVCARLGLEEAVSPLRLRGMTGMLRRIKRQVADRTAGAA